MVDIKKLIKIANSESLPTADNDDLGEARRFALAIRLKGGHNRILSRCIWEAYRDWSTNPLKKGVFLRQFARLFTPERRRGFTIFKLNISAWEMDSRCRELKKLYEKT